MWTLCGKRDTLLHLIQSYCEVLGCSGLLLSACSLQGSLTRSSIGISAICRYTEALPTQAFLAAMDEDDEIEVELSPNQNVIIKFKAVGELQPNGTREVGSVIATAKSSAVLGKIVVTCLIRTWEEGGPLQWPNDWLCWRHQPHTCS